MVPVKIKFSKSVRSNSPLQKTRILNKNGNDSFHNIKYIPIKLKKDEQLLQQLLKGSEENKNNEQKNSLKSDIFQQTNSEVFKQTQRSTSNHKKYELKRVVNKQGEFYNKNSCHNNSLCSSETTNDYEANESPTFIKANNLNQKRLVAAVNTQQNNLLNNPSSAQPLKKLYKIYGQVTQDSEDSVNLQSQQESTKQNLNKEKKEFQSIITMKLKDNIFKTQSDFRKKSEVQKVQNDTQKLSQIQDSQVNSRKLKQAEQGNEFLNQPSEIKKRNFITKVDTTQFSDKKNVENNTILDQQITQKQYLPQQNSPNIINRRQKDPIADQQSYKETMKSSTGRQKRKSQVKQKKPKANKQLLLQNELANNNINLQSQYNPYQNSLQIIERNNIQLNKIMQVQSNNQMSPTSRASQFFNLQTQDYFFQCKKQSQEENRPQSLSQQTPKQQNINLPAIYSSLKNDQQNNQEKQLEQHTNSNNSNKQEQNESNSKEKLPSKQLSQMDSPLNNKQNIQTLQQPTSFKKQSVQIQKQSTSSRQQSLHVQKQNQQDQPKNDLQNLSNKLKSQSKDIRGDNEANSSISSIQNSQNINNQDLKCSQKIFYDLPPQYSNRIKFRRLHRVYFKPRNYFRGNQLAILHFNGVLGIYENSFFKHAKNSSSDIPQAEDQNFQQKFNKVNQNNDQEESLILEDENKSEIEGLTISQFKEITQVQTKQYIAEEKRSNYEYQQGEDDQAYDDENSKFNQEQLHILQNLKQTLKKISQWYYVILILPQKSALWLEIRDYLVQQHYYCDAMYTYDNQTHDYTSYYKRNIDNLDLLNPEFKVQNDIIEFTQKKDLRGIGLGNKTFSQNMYNPQTDKFKQQQQKDNNLSFQGTFYPSNCMKNSKDSDSNNSSFNNISENVSNLDLELLIDYNQILTDLKLNQPKKVLLIDTLPLSMRECYSKIEDRATFFQNEQKQDDLIHYIQFLKLNQKIWKSFSLKFPKIKCQRSALRVVFLPSLYYEQKKFSSNSISFHQVLLEEIASEFQEEANECRYISRNKQRWYYLNLKDVFSELENQKLKECFEKHMKNGQIENLMKQPQTSIYKQEQEASQISELNLKQKIYRYFSQNYKMIELLSKDVEKQISQTSDNSQTQQQQQQPPLNQIQANNNNINNNTSNNFFPNGINRKQSLIFQQYFNNLVESIISRNNKIIKQFSQNKETFNQASQIQKIYTSFYDKTNHCISKKQQQEKIEKELDLYIARKYKSSILFYFSNFQNILTISLFFFVFLISLLK
ncbi:transmembrane protein, putative (macronuclear) [Tetrahymena thermophila SB210]|uniref:Transmembrane protein, putative n=1 Tax=Tetrahymena thermophila (strain SB210) TaxID=312017 RepID=Q23U26_TETTS|nr:transmembrane protein, putative [Tetrahymena thermophila SB210]EAS00024.2 transmembrane protein, putative [Tetrahymena thermophila SB210]|eukprot:XP_001020269.2 transmembrane protein, putative [Tetrahymena thermophila SB210]